MTQEIKNIAIKDLVLWTENPRDPIDPTAKDQDVVDQAIRDKHSKWNLNKLAKEMGKYYDYSELPIVVYKNNKPIVYDGNRRVILAKIKLGYATAQSEELLNILPEEFSDPLPCNVCSEDIALQSIYRKHFLSGNTWKPLERDIFASKYMGEDKSLFLRFDEATEGFITEHPEMNQRFVRDEILTESVLETMGLKIDGNKLKTRHSDEETRILLENILQKVRDKQITTRVNRGDPLSVLDKRCKDIIESNKQKSFSSYNPPKKEVTNQSTAETLALKTQRQTPVTKKSKPEFFGEKLALRRGDVNNLYRDISSLYNYFDENKKTFSPNIYAIFRMSLRLLCETAAKNLKMNNIDEYIKKYYPIAKKNLTQDTKTFLSNNNVSQETLSQLLNTGAHSYLSSISPDKAIGISIILGAMLKESHGK